MDTFFLDRDVPLDKKKRGLERKVDVMMIVMLMSKYRIIIIELIFIENYSSEIFARDDDDQSTIE